MIGSDSECVYSLNFFIATWPTDDLDGAAQQVVEADAQQAREALVDHLERRHAAAHDAHLAAEVVLTRFARSAARGSVLTAPCVDAVDQRVDLVLVENFLVGHVPRLTASRSE